ncbi:MAG: KH domain-containing protein [Proteobacteria bacterium]|nr:KH domain-containing protein [Pseudomonadota bacterium]
MDQLTELVSYVAKALVDEPDAVQVTAVEGERTVILELSVAQGDLGKVIGKDGRTARALRTLLAASSARRSKRAVLEILE